MNSAFLNDILECSVCLKPLDDKNKVLPCQHTFCKLCLQSIVKSHKELRCPECRVLVTEKVDDLPSNILLIRLLDGIRLQETQIQSINNNKIETRRHSVEGILSEPVPASGGAKDGGGKNNNCSPPLLHERTVSEPAPSQANVVTSKPYAVALYTYKSDEPSDLSFKKGNTIILLKKVDRNWMSGECNGRTGVFPVNYVQIVKPLPFEPPHCVALYDFAVDPDEPDRDCLQFVKNDRILVIRKVDENWAEGMLNDTIGIFPLSFVKLSDEACRVIDDTSSTFCSEEIKARRVPIAGAAARKICSNKQGGKNVKKRHSFPTFHAGKSKDETTASTSYRHSAEFGSSSLAAKPSDDNRPSEISNSHSTTAPVLANNLATQQSNSRAKTTAPMRASSLPPSEAIQPVQVERSSERATPSDKAERLGRNSIISKVPTPKIVSASFVYKSSKPDELDLIKGDLYLITEVCLDGWCRGRHLNSGKSGVFPGNYVTPKPSSLPPSRSTPRTQSNPHVTSTPQQSGSISERSYKQYRRQQDALLDITTVFKPVVTKSLTSTTSSSIALTGSQRSHVATPSSKSSTSVAGSSPEVNSARLWSDSSVSIKAAVAISESRPAPSKSPPPPRPEPPRDFGLSKVDAKLQRPRLDQSRSFDGSPQTNRSSAPSSSCRAANESKKQSEKDKKRGRDIFFKMVGSGNSKPKSSAVKLQSPATNSLANSSNCQPSHVQMPRRSKPTVRPLPRDRYYAIMNYPTTDPDEIELREGDEVVVHHRRPDGWFKGTNLRNRKAGHFPSTFVERVHS